MCKGKCGCKKSGTIVLNEEEKDLLVKLLNNTLFRVHDLVVAVQILAMIDLAFPIEGE